MRKHLLAVAAVASIMTPAVARDGSWYGGVEAGLLVPKEPSRGDFNVRFDTTSNPAGIPQTPPGPSGFTFTDPFNFNTSTGIDADVIGGYDFGLLRVEGELGYKHAKTRSHVDQTFLDQLNAGLNRPSAAPDPGAPGLAPLTATDFNLDGRIHAWSAMLNGLLDLGGNNQVGAFIGGGVGYANVHAFGHSNDKFAWQAIAGVYYPISENIDIGLKGRYFSAGRIDSDTFAFQGNVNRIQGPPPPALAAVIVDQTTNATLSANSAAHFRSISLLASLVYNFAPSPSPPPPPPPPLPPLQPTTAMQTCSNGSVILATDSCPAIPPPSPASRPERGE